MLNQSISNRLHPVDCVESPILNEYMKGFNIPGYTYRALGKRVLLLDSTRSDAPSTANLTRYARQHKFAADKGLIFRCYETASDACVSGVASGGVESRNLTSIVYLNHIVNYVERLDDSVDVVDFGACDILDFEKELDVLVVRASGLNDAAQELSKLFGGDWQAKPWNVS